MQDISWNGGALPTPTKYPAYSKKDSQQKWKLKQAKKNKKQKKKPMENTLVWRCKGDDRKKIPVAWIGVLKLLFSMQDEQLIKTATKTSVWNQPKV